MASVSLFIYLGSGWVWGVTSSSIQGLFMALCSGITAGRVVGTLMQCGDLNPGRLPVRLAHYPCTVVDNASAWTIAF